MKLRSAPIAFAVFALLAATACNDGLTPVNPPGHPAPLGIIRGTVSGDSMTAEFIPFGSMGGSNSAVSPSIYGGPSTIAVSGTFVNFTFGVGTRTWTFNVHMRNLLSYPIGSNYASSNPAPPDTSGVFVGFTTQPFISQSTPCSGCTITVSNYGGLANFTSPSQPYFWYKSRPTAVQGAPGTDTTSNVQWKFTGTFKPLPGDTVHGFTFALMVNAAWSPPNDTTVAFAYDATIDSLPDQFAKPRYKPPFAQLKNLTVVGSETWNPGVDLLLTANANNKAIYLGRDDSTDQSKRSAVELTARLQNAIGGNPVPLQAVFGLTVPGATGRQALVGIYQDHIAFVSLNVNNGQWSDIPGTIWPTFPVTFDGTISHRYRIRKFGVLDYHLCVDGTEQVAVTPGQLDLTTADFAKTTVVFGALGDNNGTVNVHVTGFQYFLGTDGGGC
jgi:hypothetical protein